MKKVFYSLLAITFVGSMLALSAAVFAEEGISIAADQLVQQSTENRLAQVRNTDGLEKILNPSEIKNYESVRKIGGSLWGKKRVYSSATSEKPLQRNEKKLEVTNTNPLEKITHPSEIKNYVEIKKIEDSLWGKKKVERENSENGEIKKTEKKSVFVKPEAVVCVKTAIDQKDTSLKTAISAQNVLALAAIDARNTCQKSALDQTTISEQVQANKDCLEAYRQTVRESLNVLKQSKENGWKTYTEDLKVCAVLQRGTNTTTQEKIMIEDGETEINLKAETEETSVK